MNKVKVPIIDNPELLDSIISNIQKGLAENIGWLDYVFGRAERLVKFDTNNRKIYTPNVYVGGNEYMEISPSSDIGNFCFFWVDDPQNVSWEAKINVGIKTNFSLIFWFNFNRIYNSADQRNKEELKKQILDVLNGGFWLKKGRITVNRIYELSENIFRGFSLDETENQFLMQPYGGFRFEGMLEVSESCGMVIPSGIVFNPIFEEEGINSYNFTINGKEAVKGNSYPLGSNVVFDIYPVKGKGVENISVNGKVYEGDVIENGKRFVFTLLESPQNIVVNLVNALVEVVASGEKFVVWNTIEGNNIKSFEIHGKTIQEGTPTPANPIPINSVGDTPLILTISNGTETQQINFGDIKLRSVGTVSDELVFDNSIGKWKLIQRIGVLDNISEMGTLFKDVTYTDKQLFRFQFKTSEPKNFCASGQILSNIFITATGSAMDKQPLNSCWSQYARENVHYIYFNVPLEYDTVEKAISYLGENYEIHYPLYSPIETELDFESPKTFSGEVTVTTNQETEHPYMTARIAVGEKLTLPDSPLAVYIAEKQTTGETVFKDQSGNGNDIPLFNLAHSAESGFFQGALRLDGVDDTGRLPLESFSPQITAETSFFLSGKVNEIGNKFFSYLRTKDGASTALSRLIPENTGDFIAYYPLALTGNPDVNLLNTYRLTYNNNNMLDQLLSPANKTYYNLTGFLQGQSQVELGKLDYRYLIIYPRNLTPEEQAIVLKYIKQGIYEL